MSTNPKDVPGAHSSTPRAIELTNQLRNVMQAIRDEFRPLIALCVAETAAGRFEMARQFADELERMQNDADEGITGMNESDTMGRLIGLLADPDFTIEVLLDNDPECAQFVS